MARFSRRRTGIAALTCIAAACAVAPAANAATVSFEGNTLVYTAAPGEANKVVMGGSWRDSSVLEIHDSGASITSLDGRCSGAGSVTCQGFDGVRLVLGDRDDTVGFGFSSDPRRFEIFGGDGNDALKAHDDASSTSLIDGGNGNDTLDGRPGSDELHGGAGNDKLNGSVGNDVLRGGDGDDVLSPDGGNDPSSDVVDGGAGTDTAEDWSNPSGTGQPQVSITQDGIANDGRPGEGDNVTNLERIVSHVSGTFVMTEAADDVDIWANLGGGASVVRGLGGNDRLKGDNYNETLDGGAGDDTIEGGFNHDTLIGGPGKDQIHGDQVDAQCGYLRECTVPFGNDTIDARDGEADMVDCGPGEDTVKADVVDTLTSCEKVDVAGGGPQNNGGNAGASTVKVTLSSKKLRTVLKKGLSIRLKGAKAGRATVVARVGGKVVGKGRVTVGRSGTGRLTIRFTKSARRKLARKKKVVVTISGAGAKASVTLRR